MFRGHTIKKPRVPTTVWTSGKSRQCLTVVTPTESEFKEEKGLLSQISQILQPSRYGAES